MESSCPCECVGLPDFSEVSSSFPGHPAHSVVWFHISSRINNVFLSFTIILSLVSLALAVGTPLSLDCRVRVTLSFASSFHGPVFFRPISSYQYILRTTNAARASSTFSAQFCVSTWTGACFTLCKALNLTHKRHSSHAPIPVRLFLDTVTILMTAATIH
jgi:hypothetical protein